MTEQEKKLKAIMARWEDERTIELNTIVEKLKAVIAKRRAERDIELKKIRA